MIIHIQYTLIEIETAVVKTVYSVLVKGMIKH